MTLYAVALIVVVFGAVMAALDLLLFVLAPALFARLSRVPIARRGDAILMIRYLPTVVAFLFTFLVVVPAWYRFEPVQTSERASSLLLVMASLALAPLVLGLCRAARMFVKTRYRLLAWQQRGRTVDVAHVTFPVVEVDSDDLALCVGGYLSPAIYASIEVVEALEPEEYSAALAHEVSHASSRDPLWVLCLFGCPDFLQLFRLDGAWRRAFSTASESAADAAASRGNPERALDLASALLKVARLRKVGGAGPEAMLDVAVASAFSTRADLAARVEALASPLDEPAPTRAHRGALRITAMIVIVFAMVVVGAMGSQQIHGVTEDLGRVLTR